MEADIFRKPAWYYLHIGLDCKFKRNVIVFMLKHNLSQRKIIPLAFFTGLWLVLRDERDRLLVEELARQRGIELREIIEKQLEKIKPEYLAYKSMFRSKSET